MFQHSWTRSTRQLLHLMFQAQFSPPPIPHPREKRGPPGNERGKKERKKGKSRKKRTLQEVLTRNKILLRGEKRFSHFTFASIPAWKRSVSSRLAPSGNLDSKTLKKARYSEEKGGLTQREIQRRRRRSVRSLNGLRRMGKERERGREKQGPIGIATARQVQLRCFSSSQLLARSRHRGVATSPSPPHPLPLHPPRDL